MSKYSKEDEKLLKELLDNLYSHHQSLKGGSYFTDFLHGFMVPFKQFAGLIPGVSKVLQPIAETVDSLIPGKKYDTIQDILSNKPSGSGRPRGRPKKVSTIQLVSSIAPMAPVKRKPGRPKGSKNKK